MPIDFKIDTVTMTTQPSRVEMLEPEAVVEQMADGSYTASKRTYGRRIVAVWGVDASVTVAMAELRTKFNSLIEHVVAFTDPTGTTHTVNVVLKGIRPHFTLIPGYLYGPITVEFLERG